MAEMTVQETNDLPADLQDRDVRVKYNRSTHSISSATWPSSTSLMFATLAIPAW